MSKKCFEGNYFIFHDNKIIKEYSCSSKKRLGSACRHFARIKYKQNEKPFFNISFIKDLNDGIDHFTLYTYKCNVSRYIPLPNDDKYKKLKKYIIKIKLINKKIINMQT